MGKEEQLLTMPLNVRSGVLQSLVALISPGGGTEDATFKTLTLRSQQTKELQQDLQPATRQDLTSFAGQMALALNFLPAHTVHCTKAKNVS